MANIEEKVENLVKSKIEEIGYNLYDVEYVKEGKNYFLRIFIDNEKGIDLNDCEKVNNEIVDILDTEDYIKDTYFLEISSPGIERRIRKDEHLEQAIGKKVSVKLFKKDDNGNKQYEGILKQYDKENIILDETIKIERKNISVINTVYDWESI